MELCFILVSNICQDIKKMTLMPVLLMLDITKLLQCIYKHVQRVSDAKIKEKLSKVLLIFISGQRTANIYHN